MLGAKQIAFCENIASGKTGAESYRIAFKTKSNAARIQASKLLKRDDIRAKIEEFQQRNKEITRNSLQAAQDKIVGLATLDIAERVDILAKIARGQIPLMKPMVVDGMIKDVEVVPDWTDRRNAIAELNKMDGAYAPTKSKIFLDKLGMDELKDEYVDK